MPAEECAKKATLFVSHSSILLSKFPLKHCHGAVRCQWGYLREFLCSVVSRAGHTLTQARFVVFYARREGNLDTTENEDGRRPNGVGLTLAVLWMKDGVIHGGTLAAGIAGSEGR